MDNHINSVDVSRPGKTAAHERNGGRHSEAAGAAAEAHINGVLTPSLVTGQIEGEGIVLAGSYIEAARENGGIATAAVEIEVVAVAR